MPATTPPDAASASPASPRQIGPYQVIAKIGEGGMGEVYRARDARLNRDVALKVLPRAFAEDPLRMARFEREAQLLASLNHPRIAAIYGLEESGSNRALVMELVEGPTLAERIGRAPVSAKPKAASATPAQVDAAGSGAKASSGIPSKTVDRPASAGTVRKNAIPIDEALPIAQQIAEALEYAHEHGVIHRDLKPANIKITSDDEVKVLDFGLAKALASDSASGDISNSPTLSLAMTEAGMIIGTAAYMSPEQAKGKQADRRADIWAFGCVLYEMLSGQKAFEGETVSDVLAAVIKSDPDWSALPPVTPPAIQRLVRRCLQKDMRQRLQAIGDARIAIEESLSGTTADSEAAQTGQIAAGHRTSRLRRTLPWAPGASTVLLAAFAAWLVLQPKPRRNVIRFPVPPPEGTEFQSPYGGMMSISPDGRMLAFVARTGSDKPTNLWLRPLDSLTAVPVPGTDAAGMPFWSPDSRQIGFGANGKLEKIAVSGGTPQILCDAVRPIGTWNRDGTILFSNKGDLYRVPDTGGTPVLVATTDKARNEVGYVFPQFLPDGRHFLVEMVTSGNLPNYIVAGALDSKTVKNLAQISSQAFYTAPGYVLYVDQGTLMAQPFSASALRFTGPAMSVAHNIGSLNSYSFFSVSPAGVMAFQTTPGAATSEIAWYSGTGQNLAVVGQPGEYTNPALSPDGNRLAISVGDEGKRDIWVYDLKRGTGSRLTFNEADDINPVWSGDGTRIFFTSNRDGQFDLYQKNADGLGSTQPVFQSKDQGKHLDDLTSDGRYAIYDTSPAIPVGIWALPLFGGRKPFPVVQGSYRANQPRFSPNGRFVAYSSVATGSAEIYVQTFPQQTGKWQISATGGNEPMWSRDGKKLFYLSPEEKLMAVEVNTASAAFQAGIPKELFQTQVSPNHRGRNIYAVSPDGRFLMIVPPGQGKPRPITVVVNWQELLKGGGSN